MSLDSSTDLLSAAAVRSRCQKIRDLANTGQLNHFEIHADQLPLAAEVVEKVTLRNYPDPRTIPFHSRWRHLEDAEGRPLPQLQSCLDQCQTPQERGRMAFELIILSVLLDAGAGQWRYFDKSSGKYFSRSEGLARAALELYKAGVVSSMGGALADFEGLRNCDGEKLRLSFQVSANNFLPGLEGRAGLLKGLSQVLATKPEIFQIDGQMRLGHFFDHVVQKADTKQQISAPDLLKAVLLTFSAIWPGRHQHQDINLGDTWLHPTLAQHENGAQLAGLVPFHKLSQWLTYSLVEPLQATGYTVKNIDQLTGLPEYRNGGLFLDTGVLQLQNNANDKPWPPSAEIIVEWRALTVTLLDDIAAILRQKWAMNSHEMPMVKILQGGTWQAGRELAAQKRPNAAPPIAIISDGTVF